MFADDQQINVEANKLLIREFGLQDKSFFFSDGAQVTNFIQQTVEKAIQAQTEQASYSPLRPIAVAVLDLQMPVMNGLQVVQ